MKAEKLGILEEVSGTLHLTGMVADGEGTSMSPQEVALTLWIRRLQEELEACRDLNRINQDDLVWRFSDD